MNMRATFLGLTILLAGCSASHDNRSTLANPQATIETPQFVAPTGAVVTPQSGASNAARAAAVESRKATVPKIRDVPASGVTTVQTASPAAVVTPQGGASKAARAAAVESRSSIIPMIRDVPAGGVTTTVGDLPSGVPYASNTDPVQIVSYVLSSTIFHPGDKVTGDVVTSSNAASVTAQVGTITVAVPKVAPGKFHLLMQLPSMPLPPGDAKLVITAIRTDGTRTTREVPITVVL
jgi:hypothetical protein